MEKNVLGTNLKSCSLQPMTGYFRDGQCRTASDDFGTHILCAQVTSEFLEYSKSQGNDLTRAIPGSSFKGLQDGDKWCLCVSRWIEAHHAGVAPKIDLEACHESLLNYVDIQTLKQYSMHK